MRIGEIQKYEITFGQHLHYYDFYNSEKLADKFCQMLETRFRPLVVVGEVTISALCVDFLLKTSSCLRLPQTAMM